MLMILTLRTLGEGVKMTPSAINAFVTQKIEKNFFKKLQIMQYNAKL